MLGCCRDLNKIVVGLESWLRNQEHWVAFQKIPVQFPAPLWLFTKVCDASSRVSDALF